MSQPAQLLLMFALLVPFWYKLSRNFVSGLSYGMVILIACTHFLSIPLPGALPELTIHRVIIISLFVVWIRLPKHTRIQDVPLARHIFVWSGIAMISLLGSIDHATSIKRYFDYVLEFFLLYFILSTSIQNREQALRILRSACMGLFIVAALAFIEKYTGFNPVDRLVPESDLDAGRFADVTSSYRHRILLGTGMAMGFPLMFWFWRYENTAARRLAAGIALIALLSASYFARSRGPWLAAALASAVIFLIGSSTSRRRLVALVAIAAIFLVARPGVLGTITGLAEATVDTDSFKGGTFQYRLELWKVAYSEISKNPWRLLFGHGPGTGATTRIDWTLSYRGTDFEVTSWDNDLAYSLYQYGFCGLFATLVLYGTVCGRMVSSARIKEGPERDLLVCFAAACVVFLFMLSNVMIFTRQLYYLFWSLGAIGFIFETRRSEFEQVLEPTPAAETRLPTGVSLANESTEWKLGTENA